MSTTYNRNLRSVESVEESKVLMINTTKKLVDILWINYTSQLIRYKVLKSQSAFQVTSFKTHPWIFRDYFTGQLMHIDVNKEVLWPEPPTEEQPIHRVYIHFPMQSLRTIALWNIALRLRSYDEMNNMEIPRTLKQDLRVIVRRLHEHRAMLRAESLQRIRTNR